MQGIEHNYPNNGFGTYWRHTLTSPWQELLNLPQWQTGFKRTFIKAWIWIHKCFQLTGLILKDAGIELLFLLIFWAIITQMGQGRDIVVSLFEPDNIYSIWRIFYTVLSAFSLSLAIWMVPAFLFQIRDR